LVFRDGILSNLSTIFRLAGPHSRCPRCRQAKPSPQPALLTATTIHPSSPQSATTAIPTSNSLSHPPPTHTPFIALPQPTVSDPLPPHRWAAAMAAAAVATQAPSTTSMVIRNSITASSSSNSSSITCRSWAVPLAARTTVRAARWKAQNPRRTRSAPATDAERWGPARIQPPDRSGLAIKNPPKKTHSKKPTQKTHLKKPTKNGFFGFFLIFLFFMKIIQTFFFKQIFYKQIVRYALN
jgi:hypothetical protein